MPTEEWNDDMHRLIVDRLRERNRKMEFIKGCEKPKKGRTVSIVGMLVAACLIGLIFNLTVNKQEDSMDMPIRSSMSNVQELIDEGRYEDAFDIVEKELYSADSTLNELKNAGAGNDEETQYEIKAMELKIKDLTKERDVLRKKLNK